MQQHQFQISISKKISFKIKIPKLINKMRVSNIFSSTNVCLKKDQISSDCFAKRLSFTNPITIGHAQFLVTVFIWTRNGKYQWKEGQRNPWNKWGKWLSDFFIYRIYTCLSIFNIYSRDHLSSRHKNRDRDGNTLGVKE